ncbi:hypothetical protein ACFSM5_18990 [Lacibacterium aquatile]|uniref:Uncharacterized protein n=1 Tax=Lacibacterium aquatile TaxID=1168082 RepID=A0ABW5DV37_9PROT
MFTPIVLQTATSAPVQIGYLKVDYEGREVLVLAAASGKIIMGDEEFDAAALAAMTSLGASMKVHDYDWMLARFEGASPDRMYKVKVGMKGGVANTALLTDDDFIGDVRKAFDNTMW